MCIGGFSGESVPTLSCKGQIVFSRALEDNYFMKNLHVVAGNFGKVGWWNTPPGNQTKQVWKKNDG